MRLKQLREAKRWSQEELAKRAEVSVEQIAELESGHKKIITTTHTVLKIARALGHSVADIFC